MTNLTKDLIKRTFVSLLERYPLTQITVKMLVQECGINRNSFYYHYQDLPALIEEIVQEEADRIMREYPSIETMDTALYAVTDFASKNRKAILHIYNSVNRDIFEQHLWKVCNYLVNSYGEKELSGKKINDIDREIIGRYYRCVCFGLVIDWLDRKMEDDIRKMIPRFCELQHGIVEEMLKRAVLTAEQNE
ncbi:MAG: TetR family transcriptional regulator C-terminal domain-containing protein [Lachnospiraceae bacterium]|nr:TetR family transcriptional regulator C-terminal domain-containing protein [Lachnospiraceae bacterium]